MGNMRDALKKAKVLSDKEARRLAHEERVRRKEVGREGLEKEQEDRQAELVQQQAEGREQDRARQKKIEAQRQKQAELAACREILSKEVRRLGGGSGAQQIYLLLNDGSLPCLTLGHEDRANLQNGSLCLVRVGPKNSYDLGLLAAGHAQRVHRQLPDRVVWAKAGALE